MIDEETALSVIGDPLDELDREAMIAAREFTQAIIFQAIEQSAGTARWLLASLLAVNGGALLASLNSAELNGEWERLSQTFWVAGIMLALSCGLLGMYSGHKAISVGSAMLAKILGSLQTGHFQDLRFESETKELARRGKRVIALGVASAAAFLAGIFAIII